MVNDLTMSDEAKCIKETIEETLAFQGETVEKVATQNIFLNQANNRTIEEVIQSLSKSNIYGSSLKQIVEKGNLKEVNHDTLKRDIVKAIKLDSFDSYL
ncbi:hypothetical protein [Staphylococcus pseudintermedius]